jgi:hypothetical protein
MSKASSSRAAETAPEETLKHDKNGPSSQLSFGERVKDTRNSPLAAGEVHGPSKSNTAGSPTQRTNSARHASPRKSPHTRDSASMSREAEGRATTLADERARADRAEHEARVLSQRFEAVLSKAAASESRVQQLQQMLVERMEPRTNRGAGAAFLPDSKIIEMWKGLQYDIRTFARRNVQDSSRVRLQTFVKDKYGRNQVANDPEEFLEGKNWAALYIETVIWRHLAGTPGVFNSRYSPSLMFWAGHNDENARKLSKLPRT